MKKQKLYFNDFNEEKAYTLEHIIDEMEKREITECEVSVAIRDIAQSCFFCVAVQKVVAVQKNSVRLPEDESCGKLCCHYKPRNGKNGCCKSKNYRYIPGDKFRLSIDGKLTPIMSGIIY